MSSKRFFKKAKKDTSGNEKKDQSPNNFRTISSSVDSLATFLKIYRLSLKIFIVFISLLAVVIIGLDLQTNTQAKQTIDLEREQLTKELIFWEDFIEKHKDYIDAFFQASILEYKLGDISKAKTYVKRGLSLHPNSEDGRKLEKFLEGK